MKPYRPLFEGMSSPWGQVDYKTDLMRGVIWVGTPGHGGMGVAKGVAKKLLSPHAIMMGEEYGGYYWFEEDVAWTIAAYDSEVIMNAMNNNSSFSGKVDRDYLEKTIKDYFPKYFQDEYRQKASRQFANKVTVKTLQVGDIVTLPEGWTYPGPFQITQIGSTNFIAQDQRSGRMFKFTNRQIKDLTTVSRDGNIIYQREE